MPDKGVNLKDIVRPIILAQGNTFIKELLRDNNKGRLREEPIRREQRRAAHP